MLLTTQCIGVEYIYSALSDIQLADYKVRVLDGKSGTAAKVRVLIIALMENSHGELWVFQQYSEASWQALTDHLVCNFIVEKRRRRRELKKNKSV